MVQDWEPADRLSIKPDQITDRQYGKYPMHELWEFRGGLQLFLSW